MWLLLKDFRQKIVFVYSSKIFIGFSCGLSDVPRRTHCVQSLSAPLFVIQNTFIKPCRPVPVVSNKDAETEFFLSRGRHIYWGSQRASCCGSDSGTSGPPGGVRVWCSWGRGQPEVRQEGPDKSPGPGKWSAHSAERWREIKGLCGVSCSHSSFQSLQQSTFCEQGEHLERVRDTMCGP